MHGLRSIPCLANMFTSCKKQLSWYNCASLVPLGMKRACICAEMSVVFGCVLVVFGCVSMCQYVIVCVVFVGCWLRQCWRRCVGFCVVVTVQKKKENEICNSQKKKPRENLSPLRFSSSKKKRIRLQSLQIKFNSKKVESAPRISVIILGEMVC